MYPAARSDHVKLPKEIHMRVRSLAQAGACLLLVAAISVAVAPAMAEVKFVSPAYDLSNRTIVTAQNSASEDYNACKSRCQGPPVSVGSAQVDRSLYYRYQKCLEDCNKKFQKDFDRQTGGGR
jgi:hypothetical protein